MKIKARQAIQVTFIAEPLEDMESLTLMEFLMDNIPNMRVNNPSYRELKPSKNKPLKQISKTWEDEFDEKMRGWNGDGFWTNSNNSPAYSFQENRVKAFILKLLEQKEREMLKKIEAVLYTESGFLREDEEVAYDILEKIISLRPKKQPNE